MKKVGILFYFLALISCSQENKTAETSKTFNDRPFTTESLAPLPGGTVHSMVSVGRYPTACDEKTALQYWDSDLKLILAYYHLEQSKVESQLRQMFQNGQTKQGLVIWTVPSSATPNRLDVGVYFGHTVVPLSSGNLRPQHLQNLLNYIQLLDRIGFDEFQIRWGTQGGSDSSVWKTWDETQYQENKNIIFNTYNAVKNFKSQNGLKIKVVWDLGVEAPLSIGQSRTYVKRLWKDFTSQFGTADTEGFSLAYTDMRLKDYLEDIKSSGAPWPESYAFDIYDGSDGIVSIYDAFSVIKEILAQYGQQNKPLLLQESYDNDPTVQNDARRVRNELGLNLRAIMQWPKSRSFQLLHFKQGSTPFHIHFSEDPASFYGGTPWTPQYSVCGTALPPIIENAGSGCDDNYCLWMIGKEFSASQLVEVYSLDSSALLASYNGNYTQNYKNDGNDSFTMRLTDSSVQNIFAQQGIRIKIKNSTTGLASGFFTVYRDGTVPKPTPTPTPTPLPPPVTVPQITNLGAGCDDNNCLWIVGTHFAASNKIQIQSKSSNAILASYSGNYFAKGASDGSDLITVRLQDQSVQDLFSREEIRVSILDTQTNSVSNIKNVKKP